MSMAPDMSVSVLLPTRTLFSGRAVKAAAAAQDGAFGVLPNHIDFVTALVACVMTVRLTDGTEEIFGIDEGILVKKGHELTVTTLRGVRGNDLATLQNTVETQFIQMDEDERIARSALSRLEADIVRRFADLRKP